MFLYLPSSKGSVLFLATASKGSETEAYEDQAAYETALALSNAKLTSTALSCSFPGRQIDSLVEATKIGWSNYICQTHNSLFNGE